MTTPKPFDQTKEELQKSVSLLKGRITAIERKLLPLEVQYRQVLKDAVFWQIQLERFQIQMAASSTQEATEKFQELRQQAIQLKMQIKECEKQLPPLRETLKVATEQLNSM